MPLNQIPLLIALLVALVVVGILIMRQLRSGGVGWARASMRARLKQRPIDIGCCQ